MSAIKTVLATSSPLASSRLSRELKAMAEVALLGQASDLSGTYILVEQTEPQLVIIGPELTRHPDFEGLVAMFGVMGTAWMLIDSGQGAGAGGPAVLAMTQGPAAMLAQMRAAISRPIAPRAPLPQVPTVPATVAPMAARARADRFILIGSSTGGIDALLKILSSFPADCPPTAIVQHTGQSFSDSLIRLLARCCAARVVPAQSGLAMVPGTVIVGAGCAGHLRLMPGAPPKTQLVSGEPVSGHLPSVDELFRSATGFARQVTAAILTGMGRDGAKGMLDLRQAGASTLAQDEATSVVYGMPKAAWEIGAAQTRLPIDRIGPELLARCAERPSEVVQR